MKIVKLTGTAWAAFDDYKGVIIDTAKKTQQQKLLSKVEALGVRIEYILMTHTHYDHTGAVEALRKKTGAKVVVGKAEADCLRKGHTQVPKGTNKFAKMIGNAGHDIEPKVVEFYEPVTQDIIEIERDTQLDFGDTKITAMPLGAHSKGSVGYKIGEDFFAGDVIFGMGHIVYPIFADYEEDIKGVWEKVIDSGVKFIYPGHGRKLDIEYFEKKYNKRFSDA